MVQDWQETVKTKRAEVDKELPEEWRLPSSILSTINEDAQISVLDIPRKCGILTPKELQITEEYYAVDLVRMMSAGELSSYEVTLAFCKRAAIAQQVTHCLTEMFFDKALERAKFLDEYLEKTGKPMGPLHGMPISLKDSFNFKGTKSTIGFVSFIDHPAADFNSALVNLLLDNGAVLYVKTNIPQTLMTAESENNIFGRVLNPNKLSLNAGGSTGGEGALIAMRGSIAGFGTDIGGSVRIPASCCGIFGFKTSTDRIPMGGQTNPTTDGWTGVLPITGPMGATARDVRFLLETVIQARPWEYDSSALSMPWKQVEKKQKLNVGVLLECPSWPISPPMLRTIKSATDKLKQAGHNIIMLENFPSYKAALDLTWFFFSIDSTHTTQKYLEASGEPPIFSVADLYSTAPDGGAPKDATIVELLEATEKRGKLRSDWHKIFAENKLDVIVTPGAQKTAVPHNTYRLPPYTGMWNLAAYPACIIPYLKADKSIDIKDRELPDPYDDEAVDGAPCSIQVIARGEQDEELMAAVDLISDALQK